MHVGVELNRFVFSAEVLMNIGRGILRAVDVGAGRIFFQHRFEIVERLGSCRDGSRGFARSGKAPWDASALSGYSRAICSSIGIASFRLRVER